MNSRFRVLAFPLGAMMLTGGVLRLVLAIMFVAPRPGLGTLAFVMVSGALFDSLVGIVALAPAAIALATLRLRVLERAGLRAALFGVFGAGLVFGAVVEWFYFEEFDARLNHIAVDYLFHPKEVLGNIWQSFDVPAFLAIAAASGVVFAWAGLRATRGARFDALSRRTRIRGAALVLAAWGGALGLLTVLPGEVSEDRVVSEVAQNGLDRFFHAFRTGRLEYDLYYRTVPADQARQRAPEVLGSAMGRPQAATPKPWDVVVILEESFGSEFIGVLGHGERKTTPGFDRWSREGLLLTNLTATGNRTVRGLEGTLCSLVPLPGEAVLKRKTAGDVATLAQVFHDVGYQTAFVYGGWGRFDGMKPFFPDHGFEEFLERDSYPADAFSTIWGVADEWIFAKVLERQKQAEAEGRRLFTTVLTVSNHRPFDVPERGTAWPAHTRLREAGVAYADWALADYLDKAKAAGLLDHTLVLVEGDHGARVYGSEEIPAASYRIPGLFLVPDARWKGRRIDRLCSQIDLAPTLLALAGRKTPPPFLGADLTRLPSEGGRAFLQHNRDVGLLTDRALVTLGLERRVTCYTRSGRDSDAYARLEDCAADPALRALEDDAAAVYESTDELLRRGEYVLNAPGTAVAEIRP